MLALHTNRLGETYGDSRHVPDFHIAGVQTVASLLRMDCVDTPAPQLATVAEHAGYVTSVLASVSRAVSRATCIIRSPPGLSTRRLFPTREDMYDARQSPVWFMASWNENAGTEAEGRWTLLELDLPMRRVLWYDTLPGGGQFDSLAGLPQRLQVFFEDVASTSFDELVIGEWTLERVEVHTVSGADSGVALLTI
jgi:hypothetical protein